MGEFKKHINQIKLITIIDSFVIDENIEKLLIEDINKFKVIDSEIFLISNTPIRKEISKMVEYCFYDHNNRKFNKNNYSEYDKIDYWYSTDKIEIHNIVDCTQPHGLSVLVNLFNSLHIAKILGYTHFQRIEVDDIYSEKSLQWIKSVPDICSIQKKDGLFYFNEDEKNISFHYFYCNIDLFLEKIERIVTEQDYINYYPKKFLLVENYVYDNFQKNGSVEILHRNGKSDMTHDFEDTIWNTVTSKSNILDNDKECTTYLYYMAAKNENNFVFDYNPARRYVLTQNLSSFPKSRSIYVYNNNNIFVQKIIQSPQERNQFIYNSIDVPFTKILVYEGETYINEIENKNLQNYLIFK